jgi:CBS domain containing-hemolysin-like protein
MSESFWLAILYLFFLLGSCILTALSAAIRRLPKKDTLKLLQGLGNRFFYLPFHRYFLKGNEYEGIVFSIICGQNVCRFCFASTMFLFLIKIGLSNYSIELFIVFFILAIAFSILAGELLPRMLGTRYPEISVRLLAPLSSFYLYIAFPLSYLFIKLFKSFAQNVYFDTLQEPQAQVRQEIMDIIQDADSGGSLDATEKKLIGSVVEFRERIAREVMVPRVNLFCFPSNIPVSEAATLLSKEGYSRIPVYENTIDNIVGVLMAKDVLKAFLDSEKNPKVLEQPVSAFIKNVLYTPETKKISQLLQEFRKKKVHIAIVVDEYGGTEGIVTIEDILEEIVGEIADEYDEETGMFKAQNDGSWIVDARMNVLDVEEELNIQIPQDGDYDTIGGYIYEKAGTIPPKGFVIEQDDFKIEVLGSNDRAVEKVRIIPIKKPTDA